MIYISVNFMKPNWQSIGKIQYTSMKVITTNMTHISSYDVSASRHCDSYGCCLVYLNCWIFMKCVSYCSTWVLFLCFVSTRALLWSIHGPLHEGNLPTLSLHTPSLWSRMPLCVVFRLLFHSGFIYRHWRRHSCGNATQRRALNCGTAPL